MMCLSTRLKRGQYKERGIIYEKRNSLNCCFDNDYSNGVNVRFCTDNIYAAKKEMLKLYGRGRSESDITS